MVQKNTRSYHKKKGWLRDIDEREGVSVFYRDKQGDIYRTYSAYARGIDLWNTTYNFSDLTATGRDENPERAQDWVRYHDEYKSA
jgi:predicted dithiol-disulfide oxidoreductase (DUF899 family)